MVYGSQDWNDESRLDWADAAATRARLSVVHLLVSIFTSTFSKTAF